MRDTYRITIHSRHQRNLRFHCGPLNQLDFREFHPPISSIELIMQDGSLKEIHNMEIRKKINELVKTDLEFVLKNVQTEIEMQIDFRNTLINQNGSKVEQLMRLMKT